MSSQNPGYQGLNAEQIVDASFLETVEEREAAERRDEIVTPEEAEDLAEEASVEDAINDPANDAIFDRLRGTEG